MFTVGRKPFLDACMMAAKSIPVRTTMPILQCLRITAYPEPGAHIEVFGTDLESQSRTMVQDQAIITKKEETCVQATQIIESLRSCVDEEITATLGKNSLKVVCGRSSFTFPIADPLTMPVGKFEDSHQGFWTYDREDLIDVLSRSVVSCADEEQKYSYDKVMIDGRLFVGTDGKRLSLQELESSRQGESIKVMVLPKTIQILNNLLKGSHDDTANLYLTPNTIAAETSAGIVTCRTAQGNLPPNVDRILPKHMPYTTTFVVSELLRGVYQASIMTDKESTRITCEFEKGELTIRATHSTGKAEAVVTGDIPSDMAMKIHLDPVYLKDMLRTLPQKDKVVVRFTAPDKFLVMDIPNGKYAVTPLV